MNVLRVVRRKKINIFLIIILLFVGISSTYAWFNMQNDVQGEGIVAKVSSWGIEFIIDENVEIVSDEYTIEIDKFYPGMEPIEKKIDIYNTDVEKVSIEYEIISISLFGEEIINNETLTEETENQYGVRSASIFGNNAATLFEPGNTNYSFSMKHPTPFEITYSYNKDELAGLGGDGEYSGWFKINFSWPDNQDDVEDTRIGNMAYEYMKSQENSENKESPIKIVVRITGRRTSSDV